MEYRVPITSYSSVSGRTNIVIENIDQPNPVVLGG